MWYFIRKNEKGKGKKKSWYLLLNFCVYPKNLKQIEIKWLITTIELFSSKIYYKEVTMQISRGPFAFWPKQKHELNKEIHEKFYNCFPF